MLNIRDYMKLEEPDIITAPSFVRADPDKRSALDRREGLDRVYGELQVIVNSSDIANTSKAWHEAYQNLTNAFIICAQREEDIIE